MIQKRCTIRDRCLRNFIISSLVLKKGLERNLTLFDIGQILYKQEDDQVTLVQKIIDKTEDYVASVHTKSSRKMSLDDTDDDS